MERSGFDSPGRQDGELRFIDTHCHLDDEAYALDLDDVLDGSRAVGVASWINVGYSPERWTSTIELGSRYEGIAIMLGMHPHDADRWTPELNRDLAALLEQSNARAVGEIGIDLYRGETNIEQQKSVFDAQLAIAAEMELPAVIHMRAAENEALETLRRARVLPRLLFHSFDGGSDLLDFIQETGSFVGVGGLATRAGSVRLRERLLHVPLRQIVLETDSPYLMPSTLRGRRNTPASIPIVASFLANLLGTTVERIADETTVNAERFFGDLNAG